MGNDGRLRHMVPEKLDRSAMARIPSVPGGPILVDLGLQNFGKLARSSLSHDWGASSALQSVESWYWCLRYQFRQAAAEAGYE